MTAVRRLLLLLSVLASLAFSGEAMAAEVLSQDNEGRTIHFDVAVDGVDAEWYAALLRAAPHGNEISTVTIDIVSWDTVHSTCGRDASGCYSRNEIGVPAEESSGQRSYGRARIRPSPRPLDGGDRRRRTQRDARVVARPRNGRARAPEQGRDELHPRLGPQHRRDLRRGLRAVRPAGTRFGIAWLGAPDETVFAAVKPTSALGPARSPFTRRRSSPCAITRRREARAEAPHGDPVQPARPRSPRDRHRHLRGRRGEARARDARGALQRRPRRAEEAPGKTPRDRRTRHRPGRCTATLDEHERPDQELHAWSCASRSRPASRPVASRVSPRAASAGTRSGRRGPCTPAKISNAWISPSPIGGKRQPLVLALGRLQDLERRRSPARASSSG